MDRLMFQILNRSKQQNTAKTGYLQGLLPLNLAPNEILHHSISDNSLDTALAWLKANSKEQDHSDVWRYS